MKQWTREERYRVLQSADEIEKLYERRCQSPYRQAYHVQPVTGLCNDPNGFVYDQGTWHLFYQWCPWGAVHGVKYWYHVTSEELVSWKNEGIGLAPDSLYDNKGVHSGSAILDHGELYFFYTGNHRDENWVRTAYTCAAKLEADGKLTKLPEPLFGPRNDYSEHQRDPKVFYHAETEKYYILIGAQSLDLKGRILVYKSRQLLEGWRFAGELNIPGYEDFGGMWECPCMERVGGKDVLIFSPQHIKLPGRAENTNHNVYLIGSMDYDTLTFTPESDYRCLDFGFDFYAAQLASNVGDSEKAVVIGWMGLPDNHYPTEEEEWEGSLTLPRELRVEHGQLIQTPISGIEALREREMTPQGILPAACEMEIFIRGGDFDLNLFTTAAGNGGMKLHYDAKSRVCTIDRTGLQKRFNESCGEVLDMPLRKPLEHLRMFIDRSSVEIFANQGEAVFTSHVYPTREEHHYTISENASVNLWELRSSLKDDFVI